MITSNPIIGTGLHAIGGISAASCYLPNTRTRQWSWGTFWLAQALFAWVIMPLVVMAAQNGAGHFEGNAKMVISTSGCFAVNLIWYVVAGIRQNTLNEFLPQSGLPC